MNRRDYGSGSVYQRASDGRWIGTIEGGWTETGARRRITVSGKTEADAKRKLRDKKAALEKGESTSGRVTVKAWAGTYLDMRLRDLSPKGYNAAASPIRKWVIPAIGHKRLDQLAPADIRAVAAAQRKASRQPADTHRAMMTMLRWAVREGHAIPQSVFHSEAPKTPKSDRQGMTVPEGLRCLEVASTLPHGTRWLFALLYGQRMGECLGLTWDAIDFDAGEYGEAVIEWQLQSLPYRDRTQKDLGFRVPDDHESRHLVDSFHLVRPKSRAGYRLAPLLEPVRDGLLAWREVAPRNEWGLVWPTAEGRPANDKHDRLEFHALQGTADVGHPTAGRPYHVHECRNFAATMLGELGVDPFVIRLLLGHSDVVTSEGYRNVPRGPLLDALKRAGDRLQLG